MGLRLGTFNLWSDFMGDQQMFRKHSSPFYATFAVQKKGKDWKMLTLRRRSSCENEVECNIGMSLGSRFLLWVYSRNISHG